jgi:hypothetical protein
VRAATCVIALVLAGCDAECSTNTDCPAGSFCSVGECTSECATDLECSTRLGPGAVCDTFGRCTFSSDGSVCALESCAAPDDEDCDGAIDEGCAWHFGVPHAPTSLITYSGEVQMPHLRGNGLRLYFRGGVDAPAAAPRFYVASRAAVSQPFGSPALLRGPPELESRELRSIAVSPNELEAIVYGARVGGAAGFELLRMRRASRDDAFGPLEPLPALSFPEGISIQPFFRHDGLELVFSGQPLGATNRRIYRSVRTSLAGDFDSPVELTFAGGSTVDEVTPTLSDDGLTIFFARELPEIGRQVFYARRASLDATAFDTPVEAVGLNVAGAVTQHAMESLATREAFFTSNRPWSGQSLALWRAQICRDAACTSAPIACAGTLSPDATHCYTAAAADATWIDAQAACAASGTHLVTIHSEAEGALAWSVRTNAASGMHLGLTEIPETEGSWSWITGEPFVYRAWAAMQPDDSGGLEDCAHAWITLAGQWNDATCTFVDGYVCETETWPAF